MSAHRVSICTHLKKSINGNELNMMHCFSLVTFLTLTTT